MAFLARRSALPASSLVLVLAIVGCGLPHAPLRSLDGAAGDGASADADGGPRLDGSADSSADADDASADDASDVVSMDDAGDGTVAADASDASALADGGDAGALDAADAGSPEAGALDGGPEAGRDATVEAGPEAGMDATVEAGPEAGPEAGRVATVEAGPEAGRDAGIEAGPEAGRDAGPEAGREAGVEAGADAGPVRYRIGMHTALSWSPDAPASGVMQYLRRCGANQMVVGADVDVSGSTNVMNGYALVCAPLNADGTQGAGRIALPRVGGSDSDRSPRCAMGSVGVMRSVSAGAVVDEVRVDCAQLSALLPPMPREMITGTLRFTNENGGTERALRCPLGSVLVGLDSTFENFLGSDRIGRVRPVCAPIETY